MHKHEYTRGLIVAGSRCGPEGPPPIDNHTMVVAADSGAGLVRRWGTTPHCIVGDMDSISCEDYAYWQARAVAFQRFPKDKDQTDVEIAVHYLLDKGLPEIWMVGAWGGRADHSLGNLELLYDLARRNVRNRMILDRGFMTAVFDHWSDRVRRRTPVSLLPMTDVVEGVRTGGLHYRLDGCSLRRGTTLGISNYAEGPEISVALQSGILLVTVASDETG